MGSEHTLLKMSFIQRITPKKKKSKKNTQELETNETDEDNDANETVSWAMKQIYLKTVYVGVARSC